MSILHSTSSASSLETNKQVQYKDKVQQAETIQYIDPKAWQNSLEQVISQHHAVIEALKYR